MINLYYTPDKGLTKNIKTNFLKNNKNCIYINCHNYEDLFLKLQQNNLFESYDSYIIDNASFLSLNWKTMALKNESLNYNNKTINKFFNILEALKKENKNILVLVYSTSLLSNKNIKNLFKIFDNFNEKDLDKNFKILPLTNKTKITYIDKCIKNSNIKFDQKANDYLYEFFPKNAEFINEIFDKINLINLKIISFHDLQQLVGNFHEADYFLLIDSWLLGNLNWIKIFNEKCSIDEHANSLLNICIFRVSELFHFVQFKNKGLQINVIAKMMNKPVFSLYIFDKIYNYNYRKINQKLNSIIVKLYEYVLKSRKNLFITVKNLKNILLYF